VRTKRKHSRSGKRNNGEAGADRVHVKAGKAMAPDNAPEKDGPTDADGPRDRHRAMPTRANDHLKDHQTRVNVVAVSAK